MLADGWVAWWLDVGMAVGRWMVDWMAAWWLVVGMDGGWWYWGWMLARRLDVQIAEKHEFDERMLAH